MKSIYICGFMGSGKSVIGEALSKELSKIHFDTDKEIENKEKMSIYDIFKSEGENKFRQMEEDISKELENKEDLIISTGGGFFENPNNLKRAKKSIIIYLDVSFDDCYSRIKNGNRPMVFKYKKDELYGIYKTREKIYKRYSDVIVEANIPIDCIIKNILDFLKTI